jgi:hypothetical protein
MSAISFEKNFIPTEYLDTYYPKNIGVENEELLDFYATISPHLPKGVHLEVGGGPTIYQLISAGARADKIIFTDFSSKNLEVIRRWKTTRQIRPWSSYFHYALQKELGHPPSSKDISKRNSEIKRKLSIEQLDIKDSSAVANLNRQWNGFDVVSSAFCIDSITGSMDEWLLLLEHLLSLVRPTGTLLLTSIGGSKGTYTAGEQVFPSVTLDQENIRQSLIRAGCNPSSIFIMEVAALPEHAASYNSLICMRAERL